MKTVSMCLLSLYWSADVITRGNLADGTGHLVRRAASGEWSGYTPNVNSSFRIWLSNTLKDYDSRLRPNFGSKIMKISLRFWLIGISHISEKDMSFTVEMFFHETWTDPRLRFDVSELEGNNPLTLPSDAPEFLWIPDTTFINALRSTAPERGSVSHLYYMKLYDNGTIIQSRRISVTAECRMDLTMYPFDKQACRLELSSYGWTISDIIYEWSKEMEALSVGELSLQDYYVSRYVMKVVNRTYHAGVFSVPQLCIELNRRSGFYFLQLIIPATAVVGSTWISLWLESETKFGDLVAVILAIIFLSYSYNNMMPKVSYVKAMDVYLAACFIFTFLSLTKLAVVKYMRQKVTKNKEKHKHHEIAEQAQTAMIQELAGPNAIAPTLSLREPKNGEQAGAPADDMIVLEEEIVIDRIPISEAIILDSGYENGAPSSDKFLVEEVVTEKNHNWEVAAVVRPLKAEVVVLAAPQKAATIDETAQCESVIAMVKDPSLDDSRRGESLKQKRRSRTQSVFKRHPAPKDTLMHHDEYWRWMKAFHVISQLILPLLFVAFGLFYFFIYPHFGHSGVCN